MVLIPFGLKKTFQEREVLKFKVTEEEIKCGKYRKEIEQITMELASLKQVHNELAKISNEDKVILFCFFLPGFHFLISNDCPRI